MLIEVCACGRLLETCVLCGAETCTVCSECPFEPDPLLVWARSVDLALTLGDVYDTIYYSRQQLERVHELIERAPR